MPLSWCSCFHQPHYVISNWSLEPLTNFEFKFSALKVKKIYSLKTLFLNLKNKILVFICIFKRNRLLKSRKQNSSEQLKMKINNLNAEIKSFYFSKKRDSVRKGILPGNSRSLWSAVKLAKDIGTNEIPRNMMCSGVSVVWWSWWACL